MSTIMDPNQKEEGLSSEGSSEAENDKCCSNCKTTKTPLWRSGPSGPKSLCNACGIRYRKRPTLASSTKNIDLRKGKKGKTKDVKLTNPFKMKNLIIPLEKEVQILSPVKKQRSPRKWVEVERAALLLMALSCGAVFV